MRLRIVLSIAIVFCCKYALAQNFDSAKVYALYFKTNFVIKQDSDLIKDEIENPIVLKDKSKVSALYRLIYGNIQNKIVRGVTSNSLDLRLLIEFYSHGKINCSVGFNAQQTMFFNKAVYQYKRHDLQLLDKYIDGLSQKTGI